jgi:hypothetical protein
MNYITEKIRISTSVTPLLLGEAGVRSLRITNN